MLLPIRPLGCTPDLRLALGLAEEVLAFAAGWSGARFPKRAFANQVGLGKWLLEKPEALQKGLVGLFRSPQTERQALLSAFRHDIAFHDHIDDPSFEFSYFHLHPDTAAAGRALLEAFYTEILARSGFKGLTGQTSVPLDHAAVESSYRSANQQMANLCPACLGELSLPAKGRSLITLDHFLPKKTYPALSVHPSNLVPTCSQCNDRVKGGSDPLNRRNAGALQDSFFPYSRPGLSKISLQFSPTITVLVESSTTAAIDMTRIQNLDRTYALSERWSQWLVDIHDTFRQDIRAHRLRSDWEVKQHLLRAVATYSSLFVTTPRAYLIGRYAEWLEQTRAVQLLAECQRAGPSQSAVPPHGILDLQCLTDGPVEVCSVNRHEGHPWLVVRYFGPLLSGRSLAAYVKLNSRDGMFVMQGSAYEAQVSLNHLRNVRSVVRDASASASAFLPTQGWTWELAPESERALFEDTRNASGRANDWNVEVAFFADGNKWDSRYGQNYQFRFTK